MKTLILAASFAAFAGPAQTVSAVQSDEQDAALPVVREDQLAFSADTPREVPDPSAWPKVEVRERHEFDAVPRYLAQGDPLTSYLVREGVCASQSETCLVRMHYAIFVKEDENTGRAVRILRYVLQGPGGALSEGLGRDMLVPGQGPGVLSLWLRKDERWQTLLNPSPRYERAGTMLQYLWRRAAAHLKRKQEEEDKTKGDP